MLSDNVNTDNKWKNDQERIAWVRSIQEKARREYYGEEEEEEEYEPSTYEKISKRIDLAALIALIPCGIGITFAWLFVGVIINVAFWAFNILAFTECINSTEC